ncbi:hypothetical protein ACF07B_25905 [Streptomyces sp. NPDC015532]|uniref:hypothetical protein n=1 Tax=Streptomyces sp. NPDC015532 TaxID=3364960 RepID=UPI0036FC7BC4
MNELRFDDAGKYVINVPAESLWLHQGMGTHWLGVPVSVSAPEGHAGGRLLVLEADLYAPQSGNAPRAFLGSAQLAVAFGNVSSDRPTIPFLLTSAQILALEAQRAGDLRLELDVRGFLPQAKGYPGANQVTEHISVAESRWRQQVEGLGRSLGVEMTIPFPIGDGPQQAGSDYLREAQRRLGGNDVDGAILEVRRALEQIRVGSGWAWPGKKDQDQQTADERWARIRADLEHQASGALHTDAGTRHHTYSRGEAETLIAATAALLRLLP